MPQNPVNLNNTVPMVSPDMTPEQQFRLWAIAVQNTVPIVNTGSPEGSVEAPQYSLYIDETVPAVPVQYRKMLPEIGGDRSKGWVVV